MSEPGPPQTPARPSVASALARWELPPRWTTLLTSLAILAAVSIGAALLVAPGLHGQQIPLLTEADLRTPFQASSPAGFKAGRDYEILDRAETDRRRAEARAAVRPVYDLNPAVHVQVRRGLRQAFERMQAIAAQAQGGPDGEAAAPRRKGRAGVHAPPTAASVDEALRAERSAFEQELLGSTDARLQDEDFEALLAGRFSPELEEAVELLLDRGYETPVAVSREELAREAPTGISIRNVRDRTEEPSASVAPAVLDVKEALAEMERFASVPGNLLPDRPALQRRAVLRVAKQLLRPSLTVNADETEARREQAERSVKDAVTTIRKGQRVIGDGELINESHLVLAREMRAQTRQLDVFQLQVGTAGLTALLIAGTLLFCRAAFRRFRLTHRDEVLLGGLLLGMLALIRVWESVADALRERSSGLPVEALHFALPVAAGAMLVRFVLSARAALPFAVVLAALAGMMLGNSLAFGLYALLGALVGVARIGRARDRAGIFRAAVFTGVVNALLVVCLQLAEGRGLFGDTLASSGAALLGTVVGVPLLVLGVTPVAEWLFGHASDIRLLELANLNHPALKELIVQAPGTYHHSIIVGSLVENASEAIGANPLLARTCAYYHDIGKGRNPAYFGENQRGENRHDALAPAMSAVIIKRHVTDGLEMARRYGLPKLVADAIPQHHGTRLVGYFFHKALAEQEGREGAPPVDEAVFRYPGPKPQFREAALVMLADAVEASCRSLPEPTTERLEAQVRKMIHAIFSEGQLDECDLTLKDLNLIAESFLRTLEGIHHARPEYPPGAVPGAKVGPPKVQALPGGRLDELEKARSV
ncbi:MAG: HDIG domain-containing protein [Myxococcaceae bacterium]|nr:HDIG domain-containing protein [Myxococcaceae bacterium]MCI0673973.1 HDIG domain-containing protein [Myxococcaceae bacterium]